MNAWRLVKDPSGLEEAVKQIPGEFSTDSIKRPQSIQDKCFHPEGTFIPFDKKDIELSITERFEKQVHRYPNRLAVRTKKHAISYSELDMWANRIARAILILQ